MHRPDTSPRPSVFYNYQVYPYRHAPELDGAGDPQRVVIVGAGPIGMATALDLARFGVGSLIIESERQVSHGSRAIVFTRRSMDILQMLHCHQAFVDNGLAWNLGRSYYRGKEVYQMVMPADDNDRFSPGLNIQQQYIEEYLVDAIGRNPLISIRWGSLVTGISQDADGVELTVDTEEGDYRLRSDWVVAADGGRSTVRKLMKLQMEGRAYTGNFVIADIRADIDLPVERRCYFDPEWNPGNNVLVHKQPRGIWRLDFRLPDGETPEEALETGLLAERINSVLAMLNKPVEWQLDWATVYSASTKTLSEYVHKRVLFVGDAAHLLPIFGVRGANTGLQDSNNLAWKLAFVIRGLSSEKLLYTYSSERVQAAREICEEGGKSTRFMTPQSHGFRVLRDAVLSLSLSENFASDLMHWRTSRPHVYATSDLNAVDCDNDQFRAGPACGEVLKNVKLGDDDYLLDHLGDGFNLLLFVDEHGLKNLQTELAERLQSSDLPLTVILIGTAVDSPGRSGRVDVFLDDSEGRIANLYGCYPGGAYLARPDQHVCGRWSLASAEKICRALLRATAAEQEHPDRDE